MPNATWPGTLPQYVLQQGFSEQFPDQTIESNMEAGRPKSRRRFTADFRVMTVTIALDASQRTTFETFYLTTLKGGSLPFDWVHPVTQAAKTFKFRRPPPKFAVRGATYLASFALEMQP